MGCVTVSFIDKTCLQRCEGLLEAYTAAITGKQRVRIQYANYYQEYRPSSPSDLNMLRDLYTQLRNQCQEALDTLPDINPSSRIKRGPALFGTMRRG